MDEPLRRTRDLDLLGTGSPAPDDLAAIFRELCVLEVQEDGLRFDEQSVAARQIREENIHGGVRVTLVGTLDSAQIPLQVDIGFGDVVTPAPVTVTFPALLDFPAPELRAYVPETVVAETLSALIALDLDNSRMKDFFDLWMLGQRFAFDGERLAEAVAATLTRRGIAMPAAAPTGLTERLARDLTTVARLRATGSPLPADSSSFQLCDKATQVFADEATRLTGIGGLVQMAYHDGSPFVMPASDSDLYPSVPT